MTAPSDLRIQGRLIGAGHRPFIIAEMSGNHNQSLARALKIVDAAAKAGAHALKLQTYTADTMTLNLRRKPFLITDRKSLWKGETLYGLYQKAYTPWEWHKPIFQRCRQLGIIGFSTPFDATAVEFLESLHVPAYKIASFENVDLPLIRLVASTGKPLIISTGMATKKEIHEAVAAARSAGSRQILLLKCTSAYPAPPEEARLATIPAMRKEFRCLIGLSDHTKGLAVSLGAVALGAVAIERHLTLRRADGGVDSAFSLEPEELAHLVCDSENVWRSIGVPVFGPSASEKRSLGFRRSLYIVKDLKAGESLSLNNLRAIRPGLGLPPKYLERLLGRKVSRDVSRGTAAQWNLIK